MTVGATLAAAPITPVEAGITFPVQCEIGAETLLAWDDVAYDLQGTCGVVRVTADDATITMPAATRLVIEGTGNSVSAKPLQAASIGGSGNLVTTPSIGTLDLAGEGSTATVSGLVERATLTGTTNTFTADTVNQLKLRGSDTAQVRKSWRTRITGSDNVVRLRRGEKLVVLGDRNGVVVERGRTTVRDRGADNVLDLRPRTHR